MSEPHTPGRVTFREDGDANHWSMLTEDGRWLLSLLHNGQAPSARQVANFRHLAACWNACNDIKTQALEKMPQPFSQLLSQEFQDVVAQRDELLEALEDLLHNSNPPHSGEAAMDADFERRYRAASGRAIAAIAKVKGRAT